MNSKKTNNSPAYEKPTSRRNILKSAGVAAGGLAAFPLNVGASSSEGIGAREAGIEDKVKTQLREGNIDSAVHLLEENNIEYMIDPVSMPTIGESPSESSSGGEFSTQAEYNKGRSTMTPMAFKLSGNGRGGYLSRLSWLDACLW